MCVFQGDDEVHGSIEGMSVEKVGKWEVGNFSKRRIEVRSCDAGSSPASPKELSWMRVGAKFSTDHGSGLISSGFSGTRSLGVCSISVSFFQGPTTPLYFGH